ncbi:YHYH protein [Pseudoalteromonas rubra]|nr:YHYH protein [Pseudoalteromonas rubra]
MVTLHKKSVLALWMSMFMLSACGSGSGGEGSTQNDSVTTDVSSTSSGSATQADNSGTVGSDNGSGTGDSGSEGSETGLETDNGTAVTSGSTDGVLCDYFYSEFNDSASVQMTSNADWSCTGTSRQLTANGIPDHETGTFPNPGNPNTISETAVSVSYTLTPEQTDTVSTLGGPRGATGYVLNGVKIDANTAGSCDDSGNSCSLVGNTGNWHIEALGQTSFDFGTDDNNAHVQPNGAYHYHGMPEGFIALRGGDNTSMTLIGWAADGFPIYARYGYSDAQDATSSLKAMTGSYQLVEDISSNRPSTSVYALGTFAQDWEYVAGSGDLDECNGRYGVTPEFPQGIYHYYATDTYPYFQRCVKGQL